MDKEIEIARLQAKIQADLARLNTSVSMVSSYLISIALVVAVYLLDHPSAIVSDFLFDLVILAISALVLFIFLLYNYLSWRRKIDYRFDCLARDFEPHHESSGKP